MFQSSIVQSNKNKSKHDVSVEVLTALTFATQTNNDSLTTIFYDDNEQQFLKPSKHKNIITRNYDMISNTNALDCSVDYMQLQHYIISKIKNRSIVVLIGDFLENVDLGLLALFDLE